MGRVRVYVEGCEQGRDLLLRKGGRSLCWQGCGRRVAPDHLAGAGAWAGAREGEGESRQRSSRSSLGPHSHTHHRTPSLIQPWQQEYL